MRSRQPRNDCSARSTHIWRVTQLVTRKRVYSHSNGERDPDYCRSSNFPSVGIDVAEKINDPRLAIRYILPERQMGNSGPTTRPDTGGESCASVSGFWREPSL